MFRQTCPLALAALVLSSVTRAQTAPTPDMRTFTVTAAPVPTPALRYSLIPPLSNQIEGNAAPSYLNAFLNLPPDDKLTPLIDAHLESDTDEEFLRRLKPVVDYISTKPPGMLALATRMSYCDWGAPYRTHGFNTLLPHLNHVREEANFLLACARYALTQGETDNALSLVAATALLANRADDGCPFLVSNLVALGVHRQCLDLLARRVIQNPDAAKAPNLYWALRELPSPSGSLPDVLATERIALELTFPQLRKPDLTAADVQTVLAALNAYHAAIAKYSSKPAPPPIDPLSAADVSQAIARFHEVTDESGKWARFPYPQSLPGFERADKILAAATQANPKDPFLPLATGFHKGVLTNARADREQAALITVEALRAYAATHDNTLPESLDDLKDTPAPNNPVTGEPFEYTRNSPTSATLGDTKPLARQHLRYEITLRK